MTRAIDVVQLLSIKSVWRLKSKNDSITVAESISDGSTSIQVAFGDKLHLSQNPAFPPPTLLYRNTPPETQQKSRFTMVRMKNTQNT
jgi:hypothetical protein